MKTARICYYAASVLLMVMGGAHFFGQFGPKGIDIQRSLIEEAMKQYKLHGLGFEYSLYDVMQCWGVFFGILMILLGLQNWLIVKENDPAVPLKRFAVFNTIGVAALSVIGALYVPFTGIGLIVITLGFAVSAVLYSRHR